MGAQVISTQVCSQKSSFCGHLLDMTPSRSVCVAVCVAWIGLCLHGCSSDSSSSSGSTPVPAPAPGPSPNPATSTCTQSQVEACKSTLESATGSGTSTDVNTVCPAVNAFGTCISNVGCCSSEGAGDEFSSNTNEYDTLCSGQNIVDPRA